MLKEEKIVYATVVLKPASGKSILTNKGLSSKNIETAHAGALTVARAMEALKKMGFTVNPGNDFLLTISGNKTLFETAFKMELTEQTINNDIYYKANKKVIPAQLKTMIEDVVFSEPMELF